MVEHAIPVSSRKRHLPLAMALVVVLVGYLFVTQSARSDIPDHGDTWTDMAHIVAARNFAAYGFSALQYGAVRDNGTELGLPPYYYTHAPSFPAAALGELYRRGLSTAEGRIFPLLISGSALLAIFLLASRMIGDWRAGLVALLALAASAPFRLLSDSFAYPSYDFAAKTWTMLFITLGGLAVGRKRVAWLAAAGITAFAMISLSGFEMVPAIAAYSILFPALFATSQDNKRGGVALISGLCIGIGLAAGLATRFYHNVLLLGGLAPAVTDFLETFTYRSSSKFEYFWTEGYVLRPPDDYLMYYLTLLADRVLFYFPIQLIAIALAFLIGGLLSHVLRGNVDLRPLKWLGIVLICELAWFAIFRQHTNTHVHTIYQLSLSISLGVAIAIMLVWRLAGHLAVGRAGLAMGGAVLLWASMANIGVRPYGNLALQEDWSQQKQQMESIAAVMPANAVVLVNLDEGDPSPEFFLERTFVKRPWLDWLADSRGRPWFLLTQPEPSNEVYKRALAKNLVLKKTKDFALFDMNTWVDEPEKP